MSEPTIRSARLAGELRRAFDHGFAAAQSDGTESFEDFLRVRIDTESYAIRLADVAGIAAGRCVAALPDAPAECLGLATVRGAVVPVYDLRALLGRPSGAAPRWLIVTAGQPVALAFDAFDGHLRLPPSAIAWEGHEEQGRLYVRGAVRAADGMIPVVAVRSILDTLITRIQHDVSPQER